MTKRVEKLLNIYKIPYMILQEVGGCNIKEIVVDNILIYLMRDNLKRSVEKFGIEGTEDKIKSVYTLNIELKNAMLKTLHELYKFG
ncbi:MAG: hypothetical protein DRI61_06930, partial [Chloroflexi bacterium]